MKSKAYWLDKRMKARLELHKVEESLPRQGRPSTWKPPPPEAMKRRRQRKRPQVLKALRLWKRLLRNTRDRTKTLRNLEDRRAALILRIAYIEDRIKNAPSPTKWDLLDEDIFRGVRGT